MQNVSAESLEIAKARYQAGKLALENGQYREAVENLEKASALLTRNSRLGGEVELWLATAYEAAGRTEDAIALCQQLKRHPFAETNKQAKRLLYILQAPKLKRPSEWMTEIPDLGKLSDNESKIRVTVNPRKSSGQKAVEPEFVDLSQVNTRDNRFIWVALIAIGLTISYLVWSSFY
ncbi:tetratricopeptide repeat protein [Nostocaceae cyanobacterium CENA369]|uniref:Tetratricopeptide repeat protein n=1 Tax=Dendronalium phyllosphericum CENA369 TaxID=1725256 RepID=A0A8J7I0M7_9NOST|nr:tetratricopeptide repeat protein [Dendronalium phyllosphericum]MBH8573646.1 tetratricopeptide repeat protein [Dendronalium phyllosphericum CENA369]